MLYIMGHDFDEFFLTFLSQMTIITVQISLSIHLNLRRTKFPFQSQYFKIFYFFQFEIAQIFFYDYAKISNITMTIFS